MAYACVTMRVSMLRWVSWTTSFEMWFPRTIPGNTGVPILRLCPHVGGWYMHPLSSTLSINDMTWAREDQCLDRTQMDGCLGCPNEMSDKWARSRWHDRVSWDGRHPKTWDDVKTYESCRLGTKMTRWDAMLHWETLAPSIDKVEPNDLA